MKQWRIQDFPEEGAPTLRGAPTYDFAKFSQKLHEIERIWTPGGRGRASKILLCRSATVKHKSCQSCRVGIHKELDRAVTSIKQFTFNVRQMLAPQITDQKATFYWIVSLYHSYLYWLLPKGPIRTIIFVA